MFTRIYSLISSVRLCLHWNCSFLIKHFSFYQLLSPQESFFFQHKLFNVYIINRNPYVQSNLMGWIFEGQLKHFQENKIYPIKVKQQRSFSLNREIIFLGNSSVFFFKFFCIPLHFHNIKPKWISLEILWRVSFVGNLLAYILLNISQEVCLFFKTCLKTELWYFYVL